MCAGQNMTFPPLLGGTIGDAQHPGDCKENIRPFNKTIKSVLLPNMFFDYNEKEGWYMSYACGLFGTLKSFFLAARSPLGKTADWIRDKMARASAGGLVDTSNAAILDESTWKHSCWNETSKFATVV